MKRIVCLIDGLTLGGAERQIVGLTSFLKDRGYDVELVNYYQNNFYEHLISKLNIKCITLKVGNSRISKFLAIKRYIDHRQCDCIIAYKRSAVIASCLLKLMGHRFNLIVSERNTTQKLSIFDKVKFFLYRYADFVVPNSYSQETFIKDNYSNLMPKVYTITNYTDTDFFVPKGETNNQIVHILVAARIAKQKNVIRFMRVIKRMKDEKYHFQVKWFGNVSAKEDDYYNECISMRKELGIEDVMSFYPATADIKEEYQCADLICLPSLFEGYPNAICEAMSCGKPVVCSNVCDNPNIVKEGVNGFLFDPLDEEDMYHALCKFFSLEKKQIEIIGRRNRKISEKYFSSDRFVEQYLNLIEYESSISN